MGAARFHELSVRQQRRDHHHRYPRRQHDRQLHDRQWRQHRWAALRSFRRCHRAREYRAVSDRDRQPGELSRRHQQHALRSELRLVDRHPARRRQLQDHGFEPVRPRLFLRCGGSTRIAAHDAALSGRAWRHDAVHDRPQQLRRSAGRQLRHSPRDGQCLHLHHLHRHLRDQQRVRRAQHDGLWRVRQSHRRRLCGLAHDLACLHLQPGHPGLHDLQCAGRLGGHAFRGHHQRRSGQHLQPRG